MHSKPKHICFIIAMRGEAKPLIDHYQLQELKVGWPTYLPLKAYQSSYKDIKISLVINGHDERHNIDNIGTQPATLTTLMSVQHLRPDLVINAGTAGGFSEKNLKIGDVVMAQDKAWYHDRRIPIPKFHEYGLGAYKIADQTELIQQLGIKRGVISTGNSFDFTKQDQQIMEGYGATIKDMEAAAIAWVCEMAAMPLIIIKGVTDFVGFDHASEDQFIENFEKTLLNLKAKIIQLVDIFIADSQ